MFQQFSSKMVPGKHYYNTRIKNNRYTTYPNDHHANPSYTSLSHPRGYLSMSEQYLTTGMSAHCLKISQNWLIIVKWLGLTGKWLGSELICEMIGRDENFPPERMFLNLYAGSHYFGVLSVISLQLFWLGVIFPKCMLKITGTTYTTGSSAMQLSKDVWLSGRDIANRWHIDLDKFF